VTTDYFRTMGITFISGRGASEGEQAAVINETLARGYWPGSSPIGQRIKFGPAEGPAPWLTITGVIADVHMIPGWNAQLPQVFSPCSQCNVLLLKMRDDSAGLIPAIRQELAAIDKTVLITRIETLDAVFAAHVSVVNSRFRMAVFLAFAGAGLLLAFAGVYGVTSYSAAQRTHEVGIRMALGATRWSVLGLMMRQSLMPVVVGIGAGLSGAFALAGLLQSYLFEVAPRDASVFIAVPVLLALVAMAANFIPARRSTRIDPMIALKYE
jgi:putative ABC transport system permease protein